MSVTKNTDYEAYTVRKDGEWANILLHSLSRQSACGTKTYLGGELIINSSFGSWGNTWGHCGMPFKRFLVGLEFHYMMGKLMPASLSEYDGDATVASLKRRLLEMRRKHRLDKEYTAELWQEICGHDYEMGESLESFVRACGEIQREMEEPWYRRPGRDMELVEELLGEPWLMAEERDKPAAVGFWNTLWGEFTDHLRTELLGTPPAAPAPSPEATPA